jgi:hypothetical protein
MSLVFYSYKEYEELILSLIDIENITDKNLFWNLTELVKTIEISNFSEIITNEQKDLGFDFDEKFSNLRVLYNIGELEITDKVIKEFNYLIVDSHSNYPIYLINKAKKSLDAGTKKIFQKYDVEIIEYGNWSSVSSLKVIKLYEKLYGVEIDKLTQNKLLSHNSFWDLINALYIFELTKDANIAFDTIKKENSVELFRLNFGLKTLKSDLFQFYKYTQEDEIQLALSLILTKSLKLNNPAFYKKVSQLVVKTDKLIKTYPNSLFWYRLLLFKLSLI